MFTKSVNDNFKGAIMQIKVIYMKKKILMKEKEGNLPRRIIINFI